MRKMFMFGAGLAALIVGAGAALAEYPEKTITMVVPYPPGALVDNVARVIVKDLSDALGQTVVVDNRGGAGGMLGTGQVARADADGYTILLTVDAPVTLAPVMQTQAPYDPATDLTPIALVGETYLGLAVPKGSPFTSMEDVLKEAKAKPGELMVGSAGVGSTHHMVIEMIQQKAEVELNHIPFQGGAPAVQAAVANQLDMTFATLPSITTFLNSGDLKLIALSSRERNANYPDVPAINESVAGIEPVSWLGLLGPKGMDTAKADVIAQAVAKTFENPEVVKALANIGFEAKTAERSAFADRVVSENQMWKDVADKAGLVK